MNSIRKTLKGVAGVFLGLAAVASYAQTTINLSNNGTLTDSVGLYSTDSGAVTNNLILLAPPAITGFNFSGVTGSNTALGSPSANGYYYADYLVDVAPSAAQSITTTLDNSSGVANLTERIYQVPTTGQTFLGDSPAPAGVLQAWGTTFSTLGATETYVSADLATAGLYVIEIRGTSAGDFGGTLSIAAVPEVSTLVMLSAGLMILAFAALRGRE